MMAEVIVTEDWDIELDKGGIIIFAELSPATYQIAASVIRPGESTLQRD